MKTEYVQNVWKRVQKQNPDQPEFLQAVKEVLETLECVVEKMPQLEAHAVLERCVEPERIIMFRVCWTDDKGKIQVNRGYRVQFNGAIGPFKGGLRFHPSVNLSILKFLGFEQVFKNSLTTLPMGGAKGGSDFDPHGKSDGEVMRFCQAFMSELQRHIGADTDVPAGDIGVGAREIGYLFGQFKRLRNEFSGVLTGKGRTYGGSLIRPEATGYGLVYFAENMLAVQAQNLKGKTCAVSGSGNVAQFAAEKLIACGARVLTLSDSSGFIYDKDGIDETKLSYIKQLKNVERGRISEYVKKYPSAEFTQNARPWTVPVDCAFPCATQNEMDETNAQTLVQNGVKLVAEGANMPCTPEAVQTFQKAGVLFAPGKASNAGGVAVSGLEMSQNSMRYSWTREEVDAKLKTIMKDIHDNAYEAAERFGIKGNYVAGANIAGFLKVAEAMIAQGVI
ncbi:NADP-specific glutamate dehydrogenase [Treponema lecithinolyticum]|uniref:NADP-specific glutamate dehydrogenase n=1 Tax=Treponema lecithinolyticum TaxID=53418 RepID=UPI0028EBFD0E|nr:NADP-specific glutamate dehydrogenase [Treponema lecithinolyticum]